MLAVRKSHGAELLKGRVGYDNSTHAIGEGWKRPIFLFPKGILQCVLADVSRARSLVTTSTATSMRRFEFDGLVIKLAD